MEEDNDFLDLVGFSNEVDHFLNNIVEIRRITIKIT